MPAEAEERQSLVETMLGSMRGATGPLIGLLALCMYLSFASDNFLSIRNILNILDQITVLGIMAVGMTLVILIGGIDLSVGSVMALAMMVLGYLNVVSGVPMGIAIPLALLAASMNGLIAGLLITRFNVPPFIATLAMMSVARGLANMITDGSADHRLSRLVQTTVDRAPFRRFLTVTVGRDAGRLHPAVCLSALPARRPQPLRDRRQRRSRPAFRHPRAAR